MIPRPEPARRLLQWIFRRYESVFLARAKDRGLQQGLVDPEEFGYSQLGFWSRQLGTCFFKDRFQLFAFFGPWLQKKLCAWCLICELWRGFQKRAFVIYDGIHYDVLVRRGPSGPGTWNVADVE